MSCTETHSIMAHTRHSQSYTMTTADLFSKVVVQILNFSRTTASSNVSAPTTPNWIQKRVLQPNTGTEAKQTHCLEQESHWSKVTKRQALTFYAHLVSIINVHTVVTSIISVHTFVTYICTAVVLITSGAQWIAHFLCKLACNMMPLIA